MNVEIGAEAALFPEKEYINGIAVAVYLAYKDQVSLPGSQRTVCRETWPAGDRLVAEQLSFFTWTNISGTRIVDLVKPRSLK